MTAGFSTSGPRASVALVSEGRLLFAADEEAQGRAGETCLRLFEQGLGSLGLRLEEIDLFAADLGPGSFTGVRVGIVLAKTLAWSQNAQCAGADAFDLVSPSEVVCLPSRRGEWFVRTPGQPVERTVDEPMMVGVPLALGFAQLSLTPKTPFELVPTYLIEPSISKPKRDYGRPA